MYSVYMIIMISSVFDFCGFIGLWCWWEGWVRGSVMLVYF